MLEDLVYILNTGRVPEGSKLEWFADGARLLGGDHSQSLGEFGLVEADSATPFASPKIEHMMVKRDGSAYQYQGAGNFRATQTFKARTGIALTDNRNPAQHGKGSADGASNVATGTLKAGVKQNHTLEPGTRNVVLYLASVTSHLITNSFRCGCSIRYRHDSRMLVLTGFTPQETARPQ